MNSSIEQAVAIVGLGAILPDAPDVRTFWENILGKRYSISEVPPDRWSIDDYYDPDPAAPDKSYSKIGGWVRDFAFRWQDYRIPPKVAAVMDPSQQWALTVASQAFADYGYPERPLDLEKTAVILGTAMGGEMHYLTHMRIAFPEYAHALEQVGEFSQLPEATRRAIMEDWQAVFNASSPVITEDSMPGELANIISGRVANVFNLRGPNYITDAACASSFAAVEAAIRLLTSHQADAVLTGGVDRNMTAPSFVKFCKIGALSATGTRPFGDGADGFVMGEGAGVFLLKRLEDAERDGDRIYAVIRGIAGASDGRGKGITAPNPIGQYLAMQRAWQNARMDPATATLVEAHGTSTKVGDVVEVESLTKVFCGAPRNSIALGSVKSNIGHLKAGAGAAGLLKAALALHHKVIPPTLNAEVPNPNIDFSQSPFVLSHERRDWQPPAQTPRRCGVSAYGFGGTNFHLVLEEHVPGLLDRERRLYQSAGAGGNGGSLPEMKDSPAPAERPAPLRGILALGAADTGGLNEKLSRQIQAVQGGWTPPVEAPDAAELAQPVRLVIDFGDRDDLLDKLLKAQKAAQLSLSMGSPQPWKPLQNQGVFFGSGTAPGKLAFLFPGQGSQYLNMGAELVARSPVVAQVFAEADRVMTPILGRPLTDYLFVTSTDPAVRKQAEIDLTQTAITQPAMLTLDIALLRLLQSYGFQPEVVMGHSLGEYAALVASGVLPFEDALEAAAARGREMSQVQVDDLGWMAAIMAPFDLVLKTLETVDGYVVAANVNSNNQCVIGGESQAVEKAMQVFEAQGFQAVRLPVSHAFHTRIVAPASGPLRQVLDRLRVSPPQLPLVANVTGDFYPIEVEAIKDLLQQQIASPVQWVKGLETLYAAGVRTFVEVGPKKALKGFSDDVFAARPEVISLFTNHPKNGELPSFNQALCGLYAAGYAAQPAVVSAAPVEVGQADPSPAAAAPDGKEKKLPTNGKETPSSQGGPMSDLKVAQPAVETQGAAFQLAVQQAVAAALQSVSAAFSAAPAAFSAAPAALSAAPNGQPAAQPAAPYDRNAPPLGSVVITGTGLGLPGAEKAVMDPDNALRILRGEQFVDLIPERFRKKMLSKHITALIKSEDGGGRFHILADPEEVIRLAGRPGPFNLTEEYGVPAKLVEALDITSQLAMAAGLDALREAGIPLVETYRKMSNGRYLPDRWLLPEPLRDETGVIFASAFPGGDRFANEFSRFFTWQNRMDQLEMLEDLRQYTGDPDSLREINRRIVDLRQCLEREPYQFDRRFLFRVLAMGHSQFAEYIGARGPNTQVNAACASTTQGIALAEDWIRSGRCRRVIVIGADNVTGDNLMEWVGAGFLATGAAATDDRAEDAALPFDRRRHGTLMGMGACALVVESEDAVRERGMRGIVELLSAETNNSAFHATRLDVEHIASVMDRLLASAERRFGIQRQQITRQTVFVSHETFTPARGGSASAEVVALRSTFGEGASEIVMANTKGFTGHPMGVGIEDVIAAKILEYGIVPPVPNFKEVDPDLGPLNLSRGGRYPVQYAIHLAAGFGSQIAMTLTRRVPGGPDRVEDKLRYRHWIAESTGYDTAELEVVQRVLRLKSHGQPGRPPVSNAWQYGTGPTRRAPVLGNGANGLDHPARMQAPPAPRLAPGAEPAPQPVPVAPAVQPDGWQALQQAVKTAQVEYNQSSIVKEQQYESSARHSQAQPALPVAEPAQPSQAPVAEPEAPPPAAQDPITAQVLALVAEKTGYPVEMLELDLDLEADLGVDTVKQAETFASIRETFSIPRPAEGGGLRLKDYPTLGHVIGFVKENRPDLVQAAVPAAAPQAAPVQEPVEPPVPAPTVEDPIAAQVLALVAEKTGYPVEMLELDLDLEADLGVDTVKQAETFAAIRETFSIPRPADSEGGLRLKDYPTLGHVIGFVKEKRPDLVQPVKAEPESVSAPVAAPAPEPSAPAAEDPIAAQVLALVAEKTGYPVEMLELDLDLEADLGVDTVKQAETFAAIRETFSIPRPADSEGGLRLKDYPTLGHVIGFVKEKRPDLVQVAKVETAEEVEEEPALGSAPSLSPPEEVPQATVPEPYPVENADRFPRRVPAPVWRPELELCKPTGVRLEHGSRVVVMLDADGVGEALVEQLEPRGVEVLKLEAALPAAELVAQVETWLAAGPVHGLYWLPALEVEPDLEDLDLEAWQEANRRRVKNLHAVARSLYAALEAPGSFLVSATRLGGLHGYGDQGATAPLGGAVVGFTKAFKRERPAALVKAVDFAPGVAPEAVAAALVGETLADPGIVEAGYYEGERYSITLVEQPAQDGNVGKLPALELGPESVYVVTGAAGSITSAILTDLAAAGGGGVFYLLDLASLLERDDPLIALFRQGKEALKQALIERVKAEGKRPTPAKIEKQILELERQEAALRSVEMVEACGGQAHYSSLDLRDGPAVSAVIDTVRERHGRIDVLVHAAGVEISRGLADKDPAQFALVYDVKADGFYHLLQAARGLPIGATVAFSSVAGRFGNSGQTDYSAANDLLCKVSSSFRRWRPETRGIVLDWTAWAGIGMATRGSIPKIMEMAGIEMLPKEVGIPTVRRELLRKGAGGEVVVAGDLGALVQEWDETGGLDLEQANRRLAEQQPPSFLLGQIQAHGLYRGLEIAVTLDPKAEPFLYDHALDGTPLLPGVMGTEGFAELALALLPGGCVEAVENERFLQPFKFHRMERQTLFWNVTRHPLPNGDLLAQVALVSRRKPTKAGLPVQEKQHFTAQVRLGRGPCPAPELKVSLPDADWAMIPAEKIYQTFFHGSAYRVLDGVRVGGEFAIGELALDLPADASDPEVVWRIAPRLLELCFQTAAVWDIQTCGVMALPLGLDSVRVYRQPEPGHPTYAIVQAHPQEDGRATFDAQVVDEAGSVILELRTYRTVELAAGLSW